MREKDIESLQHTTWRCQYHIVFAPKYRRMEIYGQIKKRYWPNIEKAVRTKRSRDYRGTSLPGPHSYAAEYSTEV